MEGINTLTLHLIQFYKEASVIRNVTVSGSHRVCVCTCARVCVFSVVLSNTYRKTMYTQMVVLLI